MIEDASGPALRSLLSNLYAATDANPELETRSFQRETTSPHAPAMAAKEEVADRVPAILSHVESAPCLSWGRQNITKAKVMIKKMVDGGNNVDKHHGRMHVGDARL